MVELSAAQLARYRQAAQQREAQRLEQRRQQQQRGWQVARQAAQLLKTDFAAQRVWLFGSMLEVQRLRAESDIDLAVEGLSDRLYLRAVASLLDLSEFSVDLVQVEHAALKILEVIRAQGVEL